jgi:hypothetical protein
MPLRLAQPLAACVPDLIVAYIITALPKSSFLRLRQLHCDRNLTPSFPIPFLSDLIISYINRLRPNPISPSLDNRILCFRFYCSLYQDIITQINI